MSLDHLDEEFGTFGWGAFGEGVFGIGGGEVPKVDTTERQPQEPEIAVQRAERDPGIAAQRTSEEERA